MKLMAGKSQSPAALRSCSCANNQVFGIVINFFFIFSSTLKQLFFITVQHSRPAGLFTGRVQKSVSKEEGCCKE
jgi:hypothetical protein